MNYIHSLSIFLLLFSIYYVNACNSLPRHKQKFDNNQDNPNNITRKKNLKQKFKRKLQGSSEDYPFVNLSIYIDTAEFNDTFPKDKGIDTYKDNYIIAMYKAKEILENLLEKQADITTPDGMDLINRDKFWYG